MKMLLTPALIGFLSILSFTFFNSATTKAEIFSSQLEPKFSSISQNIFQSKCADCHGPDGGQSTINIFSYAFLLDPDSPLVVPGHPEQSELYKEVSTFDMPPHPREPLTTDELLAVKTWIEQGALNN